MKAVYNDQEFDFEIRPGTTDGRLISKIWCDDCYRLKLIREKNPEIKTIIEIGGHIGVFTVFAATLWPRAIIESYEAWDENYRLLVKHCAGIHNIRVFNRAVLGSDSDKEFVAFRFPHLSQGNTGDGRIDNCFMDNSHFLAGSTYIHAYNFMDILKEFGHIDMLKLDCEGSELPILVALNNENALGCISWIIGEWHGGDTNRGRIEEMLKLTHDVRMDLSVNTYGLFRASLKGLKCAI